MDGLSVEQGSDSESKRHRLIYINIRSPAINMRDVHHHESISMRAPSWSRQYIIVQTNPMHIVSSLFHYRWYTKVYKGIQGSRYTKRVVAAYEAHGSIGNNKTRLPKC